MDKQSGSHKADGARVVAGFAVVGLALLAVVVIYVRTLGISNTELPSQLWPQARSASSAR